ncbi:GPI ethanolamine phosphate transferase 1 isoform X2 [Leptopilina boulardi]|nr:GPI ethanolamine phosphate transferase 1 isoform X2 [Leptopilina boulardi]
MPTESRPGNIAIVAGLYEDPSALFKGWKENPVDFDSVFNQSYLTWGWGSPDIISLFSKGNSENFIGKSYSASWQDFDPSSSTIRLDSWVFEQFLQWLDHDALTVKEKDKIIIFLHLLGCDTAGHSSKPHSSAYIDNIKYVDKRIQEIVHKTEHYFGSGSTAYLFTSDHGMTDWGSHGSGSKDETETPFIVWGAGVANNSTRQEIEQADLTPLISSLLGISVPVNNEGILKLQLLSSKNKEYGVRALLGNIKQLALQVEANRELSLGTTKIRTNWREKQLNENIRKIETLLSEGKIEESIVEGEKTVLLAKESLNYFRQYQRNRLIIYLTLMWLGWITLLFLKITAKSKQNHQSFKLYVLKLSFGFALFLLLAEYIVFGYKDQRILGYGILSIVSIWLAIWQFISTSTFLRIRSTKFLSFGVIMIAVLILIMFAGLTYRIFFTFAMFYTTLLHKILLKGGNLWFFMTGLILAVFPSLPVVESEPRIIVVLMTLCLLGLISFKRKTSGKIKCLEIMRLLLTGLVYIEFLDGRSWISWLILFSTPICIWIYPPEFNEMIMGVTVHLSCPLVLLSTSYEPLFFLVLAFHFRCWPVEWEQTDLKDNTTHIAMQDLVNAVSLMLYTLLCFFGTGNMASISSFDPRWTRHFVTVFSPFTMFTLILLKIMIPLILVGCASRAFASSTVFAGVLLLGNCLTLPLIYGVTNQGSWLDIGSAISRFIIALTLPCSVFILYYLSYVFISLRLSDTLKSAFKKASQSV